MNGPRPQVLVVEDDPAMGALLVKDLGRRGFVVDHVRNAQAALVALSQANYTTVVSDVRLGGMTGVELCERCSKLRPHLPFILITGFGDLDTAIAALRVGAHDFLPKPFEIDVLASRIARASEHYNLHLELRRIRELPAGFGRFEDLVGASSQMQQVFAIIDRVAENSAPTMIAGEIGTGKGRVARAIHQRSTRRQMPFIEISCTGVPEAQLEATLFDPPYPASPDGRPARVGPFLEASGGTLVLDEIGELPPNLQTRLLRILHDRVFRPNGSDIEYPVDIRFVATTSSDMSQLVAQEKFREDLYYRLNVVEISLPPLRERESDILALATEFIMRAAMRTGRTMKTLSPEAAGILLRYSWPGNVRELANAIEQAFLISDHDQITTAELPERLRGEMLRNAADAAGSGDGTGAPELVPLDEVEKRYILRVVDAVGGNRTRAAEILRVDRKTLYTKLKAYGWSPAEG